MSATLLSLTGLACLAGSPAHALEEIAFPNDMRIEIAFPLVDDLGDDLNPDMSLDLALNWQFRSLEFYPDWYVLGGVGPGLHISLFETGDYYAAALRGQFGGGYRFSGGSDIQVAANLGVGVSLGEWFDDYNSAFLFSYGIEATYVHPITETFEISGGLGLQGRMADHELSLNATQVLDVEVRHFYPTMVLGVGGRF